MAFANLIRDMYDAKEGGVISPVQFFRQLQFLAPHLMDHQQQDAQEFLRFLLDGLCEDLCRRRKPPDRLRTRPLNGMTRESSRGVVREGSSHFTSDRIGTNGHTSRLDGRDRQMRRGSFRGAAADVESGNPRMPTILKPELNASLKPRKEGESETSGQSPVTPQSAQAGPEVDSENESSRNNTVEKQALSAWEGYMKLNDSIVSDLFAGQLQSTVTCLSCNGK